MSARIYPLVCLLALASPAFGQAVPEILYYQFNEGAGTQTMNTAFPGQGFVHAPVVGHTLQPAPSGQFGDGGLQGVSNATGVNFVDTGWPTSLGSGSWSVGLWLDVGGVLVVNPFMYLFGDPQANSLRAFTNGAAGAGNVMLRATGMNQVNIPGGADPLQPTVLMWVHDDVAGVIDGYLNGVPTGSAAQGVLNLTGNGIDAFRVGGYQGTGGQASLQTNTLIDEFRLYGRPVPPPEIASSWNMPLGGTGPSQPILDVIYSIDPVNPVSQGMTLADVTLQNGPPFGAALLFVSPLTAAPPFSLVGLGTVWVPPVSPSLPPIPLDALGSFSLPFQYGSIIASGFTYSVWLQALTTPPGDGMVELSNGMAAGDGDRGTDATATLKYNPDTGFFSVEARSDLAETVTVETVTAGGTTVVGSGSTPGGGGQVTISGTVTPPLMSTESIRVKISGTTIVTHVIQC